MVNSGLDQWIYTHYKRLTQIAGSYTTDNYDLVSYYYMYLSKMGWDKIKNMPQNDKMKYSRVWLRNQSEWENVPFSHMGVNNLGEEYNIKDDKQDCVDIFINAEDTSDHLKDYIIDMTNEWGAEKTDKLLLIKYHYIHSLDISERILFDLVYTKLMTTREVSKHINVPHTSCWLLIKELENKLIKLCLKR